MRPVGTTARLSLSTGALGCEGIVSKRLSPPYRAGRSNHWLKVKNPCRAGCAPTGASAGDVLQGGFPPPRASKRVRTVSHAKETAQRKRRTNAVPLLGAAGLSFSL